MKKNNLIWGLGLLMGIFASCSDGVDTIDIKKVLAQEQKNIEAYLDKNAKTEIIKIPVSEQSQHIADMYVFNNDRTGTVAEDKEWVLVNYDLTNLNDYLFDTTDPAKAAGAGSGFTATFPYGGPVYCRVGDGSFEGLLAGYVGEGKKGNLLVPSPVLYSNGITHLYDMKVEKVVGKDLFSYEKEMIKRYMDEVYANIPRENILDVKSGDTTTYIVRTTLASEGENIEAKDSVRVVCAAYLLDEVRDRDNLRQIIKLEGNEPVKWLVSDLIDGLRLSFPLLKVGDKADIIVPYGMAYEDKLFRGIPPYSTIIYQLEIKEKIAKK
ncbi:FKBP-type peptidyl-prolyl cis-trans isomerase [Gabonibacter chumensis]|uniref:FKBP-type peptidyl-prolyl cis-trans isomerase n=1 Tax=Gabonibacter chumensis TaxID=2972474 RepID=UPI00257272E0|nr:FKBP-type peptidyl-prolyl cis-trans isomerase [Gabonibacter chumensis]MCR9012735.1 FKBP-type peptidyl-prolyl cis-trans isomerase [Gabonibacter chumensis]